LPIAYFFTKMLDLRNAQLYVITDQTLSRGRSNSEIVEKAILGGAKIIQLRDKTSSTKVLIEEGLKLRGITQRGGAIFIVNDRVDVAYAVDADGVHLGQDDYPAKTARKWLGKHKIIGVSAGNVDEAIQSEKDGADYIAVGSIFSTSTKPDAGDAVGLEFISLVKKRVTVPLVAIGGISEKNIAQVAQAGADCAAVISAVVGADNIESATRRLVELFQKAK
jgi:thiamine-phosphate diphosphorylase